MPEIRDVGNGPDSEIPPIPDPPEPKRRTPTDKKLASSIAGTYQAVGVTLIGFGQHKDDKGLVFTGIKVCESAEPIADAWLDLADQNPAVKKALKKFTEVTAAGTLIGMHVSMILPLLADRNIVPGFLAGGF
jgi:hypothetical protein